MKSNKLGALLLLVLQHFFLPLHGQVGIGTVAPRPTSILDLSTTTRGLLPPRLTTPERNALGTVLAGAASAQDIGMMVFDRDALMLMVWDGTNFVPSGGLTLPYAAAKNQAGTTPLFQIRNAGDAPVALFELAAGAGAANAYAVKGVNAQTNGGTGVAGVATNAAGTNGAGILGIAESANNIGGVFHNEADGIALRATKGNVIMDGRLGIGTATPNAATEIRAAKGLTGLTITTDYDFGSAMVVNNQGSAGANSITGAIIQAGGATTDNLGAMVITTSLGTNNTGISVNAQNASVANIGLDANANSPGPSAANAFGVQSRASQPGTGIAAAYWADATGTRPYALYANSGNVFVSDRVGINTATPAHDLDVAGTTRLGNGSTPFSQMLYGRVSLTQSLTAGASSTTGVSVPGLTPSHHIVVTQKSTNSEIIVNYGTCTAANFLLLNFRNTATINFSGTVELTYFAFLP